ncbi:PREDICTED: LOW QUALITY PROTEIN: rho GTPase-activating protein 31-like [Pterocles gutturalis]|uniref:LOW QUALITY PROTEIN: rho GTPase-activating protein 31-like n=1 Tax=Pterocles gutturalis TaxID=240206 RepID=UPI0005285293|nr:PREDICTED: LOW QUALITY PROTEIN: rho GTPase-activating protein 31-like [Pterocles gutturalis]
MKNKGAKQKLKRKGAASAFGCDLTEYLESSGQDVPYVLKSCAEFIETHGIVDGIYRLSGVTSNIQKLRQEFVSDQCPDLTREVYLQDIHCVGSLCKLYFRELPNPLLTYELYKKFTEAVSRFPEDEQLARIQNVIQELPPSHYRTLEYLIKHLTHLASFSNMTNMHTRNLALVWAPNLLRSKEIEAVGCNGDAAFLEVRVQQLVIEFILNHVDQIFSNNRKASSAENIESASVVKSLTLPSVSLPMKLVSLEEAQARSLSASHPARKERRENSLPEIVPVTGSLFHTVVDLPDSKRKLSTKSKKWKSIFNLGRSGSESKSKLSRNGSVFVRAQKLSEKATIRPAKSMDSLCSLPVEGEDEKNRFKRTVTTGGFFVPVMKIRTGGTGSSYDLSKENEWEREGSAMGAKGSSELSGEKGPSRTLQARSPPEQLKVFRAAEDTENEQISPKGGRMFYTSETATKSGFPSSLKFPLEASPRHQRKALNISEPFAVSVPLRVSAVISTNSTPCRLPAKEKLSLSSLDELSSLVAESTSSSALEVAVGTHTRTEQAPERKGKQAGPTLTAAASRGSHPEELVPARKPESLETPQPAAESQDTLCGQSSCTSSTSTARQSSEQSPTCEQPPASEVHTGPLPADKAEQGQLKTKDVSSEGSCGQQEIETAKTEGRSCLRDVTEEGPANALLEPLWPDIQQELKIIEPEEELLLLPASVPKAGLISESSSSAQTDSSSSGPGQSPTLSEQKSASRTPQITTQVPLFGATGMEQQDSLHNCQSDVVAQQSRVSAVPKLGTLPTGTAAPKNHHPVVDGRSECLTPHPDCKLHSQSESNDVAPSDEFYCSKGACPESGQEKSSTCQPQREKDGLTRVQTQREKPEIMTADERDTFSSKALSGAGIQELKEGNVVSRTHDAGDQDDEDTWTDNVQSLELVEPWEDHQWVTSPLHSPTFKDIQEKMIQEFQPQTQRADTGLSLRPRFSRSLSLDSKDAVMSLWTIPFSFIDATEQQQPCSDILPVTCELPKTQLISPSSLGKAKQDENGTSSLEESLKPEELRYPLSREEALAEKEGPSRIPLSEPEGKKVDVNKENPWSPKLELSLPYQKSPGSSSQVKNTKEELSMSQDTALGGQTVTKSLCSATESQLSNKGEETPRKVKTRPSSLNLDSLLPAPDFFTFESLSMPSAPGTLLCGQKEVKSSDSAPSLPTACPAVSKSIPWGSHFNAHVDLDLDYLAVAHATTGRRNSAPVSVSAVRTSFMIKMCQARAVPVIPPKIQYTQIPQPLQAQNAAPLAEKKEAEAKQAIRQTQRVAWSHLETPKSPLMEKKAKAEKENSDPAQKDSACPWHSSLGSPLEQSQSSHYPALDAPVLRRKRTSEGETAGDNPQSSKMERPSGFSKPSYRSRPGRPQSLILFSPPFPIMDHPSSADSRVLLSPIRSPTQTTSSSPICGDLSETSRTTPEGVTLRNKMTIPKNGQRLETSTSCFYQPQRRSVILDGRSGRQIE